jgi:hypothetical protein
VQDEAEAFCPSSWNPREEQQVQDEAEEVIQVRNEAEEAIRARWRKGMMESWMSMVWDPSIG